MVAAARDALAAEPEGIQGRVRIVEGDGRETGVHFLPGSFDVVLCHGVLMYVEEPDALLAGLARMLAPGGLLSLLVRNADALAMRPGLAGDWAGAMAAFDSTAYRNRLGLEARADRLDALTASLAGIARAAARLVRRAGLHRGAADDAVPPEDAEWRRCWPPRSGPGGRTLSPGRRAAARLRRTGLKDAGTGGRGLTAAARRMILARAPLVHLLAPPAYPPDCRATQGNEYRQSDTRGMTASRTRHATALTVARRGPPRSGGCSGPGPGTPVGPPRRPRPWRRAICRTTTSG